MPRDGQGNYNPPLNNFNPAVDGNEADPASWNQLLADLVAALTQSVSRDGQSMMTGSLRMGGHQIMGLGAPANNDSALRRSQLGKGDNLESASTLTIPNEGSLFEVTGTENITELAGSFNGRTVTLVFQDELTIVNGEHLLLPNGNDIKTKAGDAYVFYKKSNDVWAALFGTIVNSELGTAAYANLTTSSTDSTSGRVLKVSDFGIGRTTANNSDFIPDFDSFDIPSGLYVVSNTNNDISKGTRPNQLSGGFEVIVIPYRTGSEGYSTQLALMNNDSGNTVYYRNGSAKTGWSGWVEFYHTGNPPPWNSVSGKPSTFPPSAHTHPWDQVTGKPTIFPTNWGNVAGKPSTFTPPTGHGGVGTYAFVAGGGGNWGSTVAGGSLSVSGAAQSNAGPLVPVYTGTTLSGTWRIMSATINNIHLGIAVRIS